MKQVPLILVIDDDPDILTMIRVMLEYHDYRVITSENEEETFAILNKEPVNMVIMDMLLSGKDGTDICRRIKSNPNHSSLPVMMFSAHPNAREACLAAGANEFIAKPFEMQEMLKKVASLVENPQRINS